MARIVLFCTLLVAVLTPPGPAPARESLRLMTAMKAEQVLDWQNPELVFDINLPSGANAASLTLYADPGKTPPRPGVIMRVAINGHAGIVLDPKPQSFSARIDLPAAQMRTGVNHVSIRLEGAGAALCPLKADGGWRLDLDRSRFDLSLSTRIASFTQLEDWLGAGPWSLSSIAIAPDPLKDSDLAAFGALIVQGLALRAAKVPRIVQQSDRAGLLIAVRITQSSAGPLIILHPGSHPQLEFQGRDAADILAAARLFAARLIRTNTLRVSPAMLAHAPLVRRPDALKGARAALDRRVWTPRPFTSEVRTPHGGQTRLVIDLQRPHWARTQPTALVLADAGNRIKKHLKNRRGHFVMALNGNKASVVRRFSLARITRPDNSATLCPSSRSEAPVQLLSVRIESNGFAQAHGLSRFAVDGAPFARTQGAGTAIVLAGDTPAQRRASWRALARIALISGAPLTSAWYGSDLAPAPKGKALLVLGPREKLPRHLLAGLPKAFARGAAAGPGASGLQQKNATQWLVHQAYAKAPVLPGLGVAGYGHMGSVQMLVLSAETRADFVPAMNAFADGHAIDFFAGKVLRWRAGRVEINAIDPAAGKPVTKPGLPFVLFLVAGLCLAGLWTIRWRRVFEKNRGA